MNDREEQKEEEKKNDQASKNEGIWLANEAGWKSVHMIGLKKLWLGHVEDVEVESKKIMLQKLVSWLVCLPDRPTNLPIFFLLKDNEHWARLNNELEINKTSWWVDKYWVRKNVKLGLGRVRVRITNLYGLGLGLRRRLGLGEWICMG